jgi:hypothetical protein
MTGAASIYWPASRALEGLALLARVSRLPVRQTDGPNISGLAGMLDIEIPRAAAAAASTPSPSRFRTPRWTRCCVQGRRRS